MAYQQSYANGESAVSVRTKLNNYMARVIYPEDYGAVGDGSTDDAAALQEWANAVCVGSNKFIGASRRAAYMTSAAITFSGTPIINFQGTIRRTTASTATEVVQFTLGSAGLCEITMNVDGNSANANPVVGILIDSGSNNNKSTHRMSAINCTTGIKVTDNVEKIYIDSYVRSCGVGVNVNNDGSSATPDEVYIRITGSDCDNAFLADGTEKTSGQIVFNFEQADDNTKYAADIQNGVWLLSGEVRGVHGGIKISTNAALSVDVNMTIFAKGDTTPALQAIMCDAPNCVLSGRLILFQWNDGAWIKRCSSGSGLQFIKRDSGGTGTGLRIGDFANSLQVGSFNVRSSCLFGSTAGLHLDYATNCTVEVDRFIEGGVNISANSSGNRLSISKSNRAVSITNSRTQLDNVINFKGAYSNAELEEISSPIKGMFAEASGDTSVYGSLYWNGSNWRSGDGKTYNATTNAWS